ncbi:MAG: TIGR03826 family flagellar region protein [Tumebacillaceae bacterium]
MGLANCKHCGRLYNQAHRDICPVCIKEEDDQFIIIRNYLKDHRGASVSEVSEATEVETLTIIKFIREGRLSAFDNPNLNFPCEACSTPIVEGRFCKPCKDRLKNDLSSTKKELEISANDQNRGSSYLHKRDR